MGTGGATTGGATTGGASTGGATTGGATTGGATTGGATTGGATTGGATTGGATTGGATTGGATTGAASTGEASTGADGLVIQIDGAPNMQLASDCPVIDYACGAQAVCEWVTNSKCVSQNWDCIQGDGGLSFHSENDPPKAANFAAYAVAEPNGNICSCDPAWFGKFGIPQKYLPCTEGGWHFVQ